MANGDDVPEGMQRYPVTSPDGVRLYVTAPKGTPNDQILQYAAKQAQTNPGKIKPDADLTVPEAFVTGMTDPAVGGHQLYSHLMESPEEAHKVDTQVQAREADIRARGGGGISRQVGRAAIQAPLALATGALGPAGAVGGGAISGLTEPVASGGDYWTQKSLDTLFGGAFGFAFGGGLAGTMAKRLTPEARTMIQSGVNLTPGQIMGGPFRRIEEAASSLPILGNFIRGAEGRGVGAFNRSIANQALAPIGGALPKGVEGRAAVGAVESQLSDAYDQLLPRVQVKLDDEFQNKLHVIRDNARELPTPIREQFENILQNRLGRYFDQPQTAHGPIPATGYQPPGGPMPPPGMGHNLGPQLPPAGGVGPQLPSQNPAGGQMGPQMVGPRPVNGETFKEGERALRDLANKYRQSSDVDQQRLGWFLDDVRAALRDALIRQNPNEADQLRNIDLGWAMLTRLQDASNRSVAKLGRFTAVDLLNAVKNQDKTIRHSAFAKGDALMQTYAEAAQKVLPHTLPDSGTTERYLTIEGAKLAGSAAAGGAAVEAGAVSPATVLAAGAGLTAAGLPYTRAGLAALNSVLRNPALGQSTLGRAAPYLAVGAEPLASGPPPYGGPQQ